MWPLFRPSLPPLPARHQGGGGAARRTGRSACSLGLALLVVASLASSSAALAKAKPAAPAKATSARTVKELAQLVEEQRTLLEAQRKQLADQQKLLDEQEKRLADLEKKLEEASSLALSTHNELNELQQQSASASVSAAVEARLAEVEQTVNKVPEMAVQNLQGDFPRSIKIPGTDAAIRFGGLARMVFVDSFDPIGSDDRFVTSSIPIEGSEQAGKTSRIEFSVNPSRFNADIRTPTGVGHMRAFLEGDFAGSSSTLRLRHAFGQWHDWLGGQTWSTFSDPEAEPDGIDFEGLNAISLLRQPQVRWTRDIGARKSLAIAAEEANPSLTGATGVNQVPDFVIRLRWDPERAPGPFHLLNEGGHIQTSLLLRQLRGEVENSSGQPSETLSTWGYGLALSGVLPTARYGDNDRVRWAFNAGRGIGRYITDLGTVGGQDAYYDPEAHALEPLPVAAAYAGYEHWWKETLRSTVTAGYVWVDNLEHQPLDSLKRTDRYTLNLAWSPIPSVDLIVELLWGRRFNLDGQSGQAGQLQFGSTFRF